MKRFAKWFITGFFITAFIGAGAAAGLAIAHTAFPTADTSTEFGIPYAVENQNTILQTNMLSKTVVINNPSNPYPVPANTAYVIFVGTQASNVMSIQLPSAVSSLDNQEVSIFGQAAVSSVSVTSAGASAVGAPSAPTAANWHAKYKYDAGTTTWYAVDN